MSILRDFCGNDELVESLENMIKSDTLPRSLMLTAEQGCGRNKLARLIAGELLGDTAGLVERSVHPDCITLCGSGASGLIKVEDVRAAAVELSKGAVTTGGKRVCLVRDAGNLSRSSAAALLKILEEPPAQVYFLLSVRSGEDVPDTIVSRCVRFAINPLSDEECISLAEKLRPGFSDTKRLAMLVQGRAGLLLKAIDDPRTCAVLLDAEELSSALLSAHRLSALSLLSRYEKRAELAQLLELASMRIYSKGKSVQPAKSAVALGIGRMCDECRIAVYARNASPKLAAARLVSCCI